MSWINFNVFNDFKDYDDFDSDDSVDFDDSDDFEYELEIPEHYDEDGEVILSELVFIKNTVDIKEL